MPHFFRVWVRFWAEVFLLALASALPFLLVPILYLSTSLGGHEGKLAFYIYYWTAALPFWLGAALVLRLGLSLVRLLPRLSAPLKRIPRRVAAVVILVLATLALSRFNLQLPPVGAWLISGLILVIWQAALLEPGNRTNSGNTGHPPARFLPWSHLFILLLFPIMNRRVQEALEKMSHWSEGQWAWAFVALGIYLLIPLLGWLLVRAGRGITRLLTRFSPFKTTGNTGFRAIVAGRWRRRPGSARAGLFYFLWTGLWTGYLYRAIVNKEELAEYRFWILGLHLLALLLFYARQLPGPDHPKPASQSGAGTGAGDYPAGTIPVALTGVGLVLLSIFFLFTSDGFFARTVFFARLPGAYAATQPLRILLDRDRDGFLPFFGEGDPDNRDPRRLPYYSGGQSEEKIREQYPYLAGKEYRDYPDRNFLFESADLAFGKKLQKQLASGGGGKPNLLLITLDTWRADYFQFSPRYLERYPFLKNRHQRFKRRKGEPFRTHGALTGLLEQGWYFADAFSSRPVTRYSLRSMARGHFTFTLKNKPGLFNRWRRAGYRPVMVTGSRYSIPHFQKSKLMPETYMARPEQRSSQNAAQVMDAGRRWIKKLEKKNKPWVLWLHTDDPHVPYLKKKKFDFGNGRRDRYRSELAYSSFHINRLIRWLRRSPAGRETVVILFGDHGENMGETGLYGHTISVHPASMRVPLVLWLPTGLSGPDKGRAIAPAVNLVDIMPWVTREFLADSPGGQVPAYARRDGAPPDRYYFTSYTDAAVLYRGFYLMKRSVGKHIYGLAGWPGYTELYLYDLARDPRGLENLWDSKPAIARFVYGQNQDFFRTHKLPVPDGQ